MSAANVSAATTITADAAVTAGAIPAADAAIPAPTTTADVTAEWIKTMDADVDVETNSLPAPCHLHLQDRPDRLMKTADVTKSALSARQPVPNICIVPNAE